MNLSDKQRLIEQVALLAASFVWTLVVLTIIILIWVYQDVQARWEYVLNAPPEALAQAAPPTVTPFPTPTLWAGPGPTPTPTATKPPTPTATQVVAPPAILPETFVPGEPTPVIVATVDTEVEPVNINPEPPPASVRSPTPGPTQISFPPDESPVVPPSVFPTPPQPTSPTQAPSPKGQPNPISNVSPTRLVIEAVGIDSDIVPVGWSVVEQNGQQYSIWNVAEYAVGWHKTTAPLGQSGNTVMAGHNNVKGEVFRDLVNVEIGDKLVTYAGNQKFEYEITLKTIVREKGEPLEVRQRNAQWIAPTDDERLTLVTCWPYTSNTHRVIVVARPI